MISDWMRRRIILMLLALNVFFAAALGTFLLRDYLVPPDNNAGVILSPAQRFEALAAQMTPQDAAWLRTEYAAKEAAINTAREAIRRARQTMRDALSAEPFDPDAVRAAMADVNTARQKLAGLLQDVILSAAAKLTPQDRAKLADWPRSAPSKKQ